jgi:hypothetical protein
MTAQKSSALPAHPSTREQRGLALYRDRGHEIRQFGTGLYRAFLLWGGLLHGELP